MVRERREVSISTGWNIQRFGSLRYRAAPSSGLLLTLPMAMEAEGQQLAERAVGGWVRIWMCEAG